MRFPERKNVSFYRNHLVVVHKVDHKFPGMDIIVNRTLKLQLFNNKKSLNITTQQKGSKLQKSKSTKDVQNSQSHNSGNSAMNLEDELLEKAALGK